MNRLRFLIVVLLIDLAVLFNIERLDIGRQNVLDIQSFAYVMAMAGAAAILLLPALWRRPAALNISLLLSLYLLSRMAIVSATPILGGAYTYLTITELVLLGATFWLAHQVAGALYEFEEAVENITFIDSSRRFLSMDERGEEVIKTELIRSRRHQNPLSLIVVEPEPGSIQVALHRIVREVQQAMMSRYVLSGIGRMIGTMLRRTDYIIEQRDQNRFIILTPETDAENSTILAERIRERAEKALGVSVACGIASFPDGALTFEDLVHEAESNMQHSAEPDLVPYAASLERGTSS